MNDFQTGTITYYQSTRNRLKAFRMAQRYLKHVFDMSLTMSDKMELRHEVNSAIE
jgi:hypothetical protein